MTSSTASTGSSMNALRLGFLAFLLLALALVADAQTGEVTLFDADGRAGAYVDASAETTIYPWSGRPVAYLEGKSIYGFNGRHPGWFDRGVVRDHQGHCAGFAQGVTGRLTRIEGLKSLKSLKPLKSLKELEPPQSPHSAQSPRLSLELLLLSGSG